ncbi:hypothetical protein LCGC14_1056890 [marine sediment metagenome]|uniref:Uncharacterized protein n=1 Tax=marine sediment metagenome TaxID=412755 RepID=A0A0F9MMC0_9ZZZZ
MINNQTEYRDRVERGLCVACSRALDRDAVMCQSCADHNSQLVRDRGFRNKLLAFEAYGGAVCACCGETEIAFLTLDHVNGDGNKRRELKGITGVRFYRILRQQGYPTDPPLQVLCFNCNSGRAINNGVCPHKEVVR